MNKKRYKIINETDNKSFVITEEANALTGEPDNGVRMTYFVAREEYYEAIKLDGECLMINIEQVRSRKKKKGIRQVTLGNAHRVIQ